MPYGPPNLWPVMVIASSAAGGERDRQRADGLHRIGVQRDAELVGDLGQLRDRLHGADLVVGPHHADQRGRVRVGASASYSRRGLDPAGAVDRQPDELGALLGGQPLRGVEHRVVLDPADQQPAPARIGRALSPEHALDGEVVALGAAAGEDHLGGAGVQREGDRFAGFLDRSPGADGRSHAAKRRCRRSPGCPSPPQSRRDAPASSPHGRGTPYPSVSPERSRSQTSTSWTVHSDWIVTCLSLLVRTPAGTVSAGCGRSPAPPAGSARPSPTALAAFGWQLTLVDSCRGRPRPRLRRSPTQRQLHEVARPYRRARRSSPTSVTARRSRPPAPRRSRAAGASTPPSPWPGRSRAARRSGRCATPSGTRCST